MDNTEGQGPEAIALAHEKAAVAHEEAANAAAKCRNYSDEERHEGHFYKDGAEQASDAELTMGSLAAEASAVVVEMTRLAPTDGDVTATQAAQAALDAPSTDDRHKTEAEVASRAAAEAHRWAAREYRLQAQTLLTEEEGVAAYELVDGWYYDMDVRDWARLLIDLNGPDWMRGALAEEVEAKNALEAEEQDVSCDQCQALMVNGVYCHETGCPNTKKVKVDGEWITPDDEDE